MKSIIKHKKNVTFFIVLVLFSIVVMQGCGNENTAPAGSTITINQDKTSEDTGGAGLPAGQAIPFDFTVAVTYSDGTPMPNATLTISGGLAIPNTYIAYQFYHTQYAVGHTDTENSPFQAQTNDSGVYTFSALVSGPVTTFKDNVYVTSGTNVATGSIEIK
jgi:hypothetical protein